MPEHDPEELLDVVDEGDRVVGRASREVVHRDGLRHRASHVFVLNSHGELLLQRRALTKDEHPGFWDSSAAGHLDAGESYRAGAVRELREELGLAVDPASLAEVATLPATAEGGWEFRRLFVVTTDAPLALDPTEVMEGRFLTPEELERRLADGTLTVTRAFTAFYALYRAWAARAGGGTPP